MAEEVQPVSASDIEAARRRLAALGMFSPLMTCEDGPPGTTVRLKLENLQPIGSFKVRPIGNAVLTKDPDSLREGIYAVSSGNSALGVAWMARRLGLTATAVVPVDAPHAKLTRLRALGARIETRSIADWWQAIKQGTAEGQPGLCIDACRDPAAVAGDGTIGLEILAGAPDTDAIFVPFGGGSLACGIACAVRALHPSVKIIACELDTAHPLKAAFAAGGPVETPHASGFVSGVGYGTILREMWPLARSLVDAVVTVSLAEVAATIKLLAEHYHVVAEGAGAIPAAAALLGRYPASHACAVVSGGNLDTSVLSAILSGGPVPGVR